MPALWGSIVTKAFLVAGHEGDEFLERAFWSSLTVKPPLYGADTPYSLFDEDVASGWNLRKLRCLLDKYNVPDIPGVTTPMTYFGMWKVRVVVTGTTRLH